MELRIKSARGTEVYYKDTSLELVSPILSTAKYAGELKTGDQLICHVIPSIMREIATYEKGARLPK